MNFKVGDKVQLIDDPLKRDWIETVETVQVTYTELITTNKHPNLINASKFEKHES